MNPLRHAFALSLLASLIPSSNAFSFFFTSTPTQCGSLTVEWTGGQAPFTLLLVPTGHLNPETRSIIQQDVSSGSSVTFTLDLPAGSQFIAVLNDATGVGAGGTSVITTVGDSSDTSCLNTQQVSPEFFLFLPTSIGQCGSVDISWGSQAQAPVSILGLIPGGQSFEVASVTDSSTSFDWTADVRQGTDVIFVAGDKNGLGKGGSSDIISIGSGSDGCINSNTPSSTTGNAAGGVSPTSTSTSTSGGSSGSGAFQFTSTNNAGSTVTLSGSPPVLTTTNSQGQPTTITEGQPAMTTTDSSGHTTTISGFPITTTDVSGSTVTLGGSSFPGSGGGTVTGSSDSSNNSSKNRLPLILGVVFGLGALLGLLIGGFILWRRRSQHAYSNLENGKGPEADTQPWFARGAHLRGGANSSVSTLPSMYQTEPFIMPSGPQSYYSYSPTPTPAPTPGRPQFSLQRIASQSQIPPFQHPGSHSRASSSRSIHSFLDNAPLTPTAFGYGLVGTPTSSDSKHSSNPGPHGRPPSRTSSSHALPPGAARAAGSGLPPPSNPDPPTRVTRDSEDFSPDAEEASPNPFEDPVVDIPPTYASVRRASIHRSLESTRPSGVGAANTRQAAPRGPRPGGALARSNASRMSFQTEDGVQGSQSHSHESS